MNIIQNLRSISGASTPTAAQVTYDSTGSGLTATNVQDAIDEVAQGGGSTIIKTVTADGVKTYSQILDEFWSEHANIKPNSLFSMIDSGNVERVATLSVISASNINFENVVLRTGGYGGFSFQMRSSGSSIASGSHSVITDISSTVPTAGTVFNLYA